LQNLETMNRFAQLAVVAALGVFVAACSDHAAELEAARSGGKTSQPISAATPGLATTPQAGATPGLPGGATPGGQLPSLPSGPGGPTGCQPQQVAQVQTPQWRPPSQPRQACSQQEALALIDCAFSNQNCNIPSPTCKQCAVSMKSSAQQYGPIIIDDTTQQGGLELNVEGCAAILSQDISGTGCGPRLQAKYACEEQACAQCASADEMAACMQAADTSACAQYVQAASSCEQYAQTCLQGGTEQDVAFSLLGMFCGM